MGVLMSSAFWIFGLGTTGVLGYVFMNGSVADPNVYNMTPAELRSELKSAETSYDMGYGHMRSISGAGLSGERVKIAFSGNGKPLASTGCYVAFEPLDEEKTRVVPECGAIHPSAHWKATAELLRLEVQEHVTSVLRNQPYDQAKVSAQGAAVLAGNIKDMHAESLDMQEQLQTKMTQEELKAATKNLPY